MGYLAATVLTPALVILLSNRAAGGVTCTRVCEKGTQTISCRKSWILVNDVTTPERGRNALVYENVKRSCMGMETCNLARTCDNNKGITLVVHFSCVERDEIEPTPCSKTGSRVPGLSGHIRSEGYPSLWSAQGPCHWWIKPAPDGMVVLQLHDFPIKSGKYNCSLTVSGRSCQGQSFVRQFCGWDNSTTLVSCDRLEISAHAPPGHNEVRFWLFFQELKRSQAATIPKLPRHCPAHQSSQDLNTQPTSGSDISSVDPTMTVAMENQDSSTEVLVVMLSIISGMSAVLIAILIVVCVRCRLLQSSLSHPVYSDRTEPSVTSGQAHYEFVSSSDMETSRPQLLDGYYQVADALPASHKSESTLTTAGYVEVMQFQEMLTAGHNSETSKTCPHCTCSCDTRQAEFQKGDTSSHDGNESSGSKPSQPTTTQRHQVSQSTCIPPGHLDPVHTLAGTTSTLESVSVPLFCVFHSPPVPLPSSGNKQDHDSSHYEPLESRSPAQVTTGQDDRVHLCARIRDRPPRGQFSPSSHSASCVQRTLNPCTCTERGDRPCTCTLNKTNARIGPRTCSHPSGQLPIPDVLSSAVFNQNSEDLASPSSNSPCSNSTQVCPACAVPAQGQLCNTCACPVHNQVNSACCCSIHATESHTFPRKKHRRLPTQNPATKETPRPEGTQRTVSEARGIVKKGIQKFEQNST